MHGIRAGDIGRARPVQFQKRFLEAVVGFRDARRQAQTETIEAWCEQPVQLLEDRVLAASVTFHE